ncbi:MAG: hypothetical protein Q7T11_01930, partial [Deltaproteobacteria bacterium]|nr:hypothetical protein [Deltaproteobacteria bacterium]
MSFAARINHALAQVPGHFTETQAEILRGVQSPEELDARLSADPEFRRAFEAAQQNAAFQQAWEAHEELRGITGDTAAGAAAGLDRTGARFHSSHIQQRMAEEMVAHPEIYVRGACNENIHKWLR